ncbi:MAG: low-specificity L-threonine aldolase [Candidatus Bipolaricaulota bacterium]|nr:low-specificity L-threonine aldolase [Candidatus Bipolaricaulota bacterium]
MTKIDLRSDTVTRPSPEMRKEMANAEVGDDVYAEDPTVNELQELAAEILDFEAGLFVPSGTMGNQVAIWSHTTSGQEVIVEEDCHIFNYELGTASAFSGVTPRPVSSPDGVLKIQKIRSKITPDKYYLPETGMIALENTHNNKGGRVYPYEELRKTVNFAREKGIPLHLDGARLFNASIASGREPGELVRGFDSVMFCLSKGLGAPVGSMLVGNEEFIKEALIGRKRFGGGMRQAGVIAAAGIYSLNNNISRLQEDHENAKILGQELKDLGFGLTPDPVETNIIFVNTQQAGVDAFDLAKSLRKKGIVIGPRNSGNIRFVTHLDVNREDIEKTIKAIKDYLAG